jgi:hypothetical protein
VAALTLTEPSIGRVTARLACFGVTLVSDVPLGELPEADEQATRPEVRVRYGSVPTALPMAQPSRFGLQAAGDAALLTVARVGRFLIRGGAEIVVDPLPNVAERDVRLFVLAYQRGLLPLHANAVVLDGKAHAFVGPSGAGKSTLAAYFTRRGIRVLSDDVCALSFDADGRPLAWPGLPRVKLWQDAADALGQPTAGLEPAIEGQPKYHVPVARRGELDPVPLARVYTLGIAEAGARSIEQVIGAAAMAAVIANSYRGMYAGVLGLEAQHFRQSALLCRSARVFAVARAWGFDRFAAEAARLEAHMREEDRR